MLGLHFVGGVTQLYLKKNHESLEKALVHVYIVYRPIRTLEFGNSANLLLLEIKIYVVNKMNVSHTVM